jgi:hypothetical protein
MGKLSLMGDCLGLFGLFAFLSLWSRGRNSGWLITNNGLEGGEDKGQRGIAFSDTRSRRFRCQFVHIWCLLCHFFVLGGSWSRLDRRALLSVCLSYNVTVYSTAVCDIVTSTCLLALSSSGNIRYLTSTVSNAASQWSSLSSTKKGGATGFGLICRPYISRFLLPSSAKIICRNVPRLETAGLAARLASRLSAAFGTCFDHSLRCLGPVW